MTRLIRFLFVVGKIGGKITSAPGRFGAHICKGDVRLPENNPF